MSEPLPTAGPPRFVRLAETGRPPVSLRIDGEPALALQGDSLLVAMLSQRRSLRRSEFGEGEARAGFCLMGACQDCWVWDETGQRLRACSTPVLEGMCVRTAPPALHWPATPDLKIVQERQA
ncbi:(2Fe-2S)-binding protein [Paucibacter sp. PLA-PC-4]|uniref:(2Fe-2S)-binding protein n=1 Tax=Paucibacter sp. PLA-PC-4 TaxID=2993655 RepID=UPI002249344B|nr:(2Fe-2S)-binding protein [Paucibacter sp. PLA-PC-4]MCX2861092.1 (2Fe-2S)-binding protein [Paucibacter sp. PLA-PC-4]